MLKQITFRPYKCFTEGIIVKPPKLVNLVIGKNNSGKTSFLDMMSALFSQTKSKQLITSVSFEIIVESNHLRFLNVNKINPIYGTLHKTDGAFLIGKKLLLDVTLLEPNITICLNSDCRKAFRDDLYDVDIINSRDFLSILLNHRATSCFKIAAERDIKEELKENSSKLKHAITENGVGIVNYLLFNWSNKKGNRKVISELLNEINEMLRGDCIFTGLAPLEKDDNTYEITFTNLDELEIPLSEMGSGVKTILFALLILQKDKFEKNDSILLFEELENNLHPEIQRRLFDKIYNYSIENNCRVFITSHSNVAINTFFGRENVMIYHVVSDDKGKSNVFEVSTSVDKQDILNDLGVKASDIFQSNGIIWVEGPSDRVYINKWLSLVDPSLKENVDYTFLFYGGRLLSHYSADESIPPEAIDILLTNRNSALIMDSDIKQEGDAINTTKQRIVNEFATNKFFCWVTKGREIENYINKDAVNALYPKANKAQIGLYEDFKDYISEEEPCFEGKKVKFAKDLSFKESDLNVLDLKEKITILAETIRKWNE